MSIFTNDKSNVVFLSDLCTKYRSDLGFDLQDLSLSVFVNSKTFDWLMRISLVILLGPSLARTPADLSRVRHPQVCPCTSVQRLD